MGVGSGAGSVVEADGAVGSGGSGNGSGFGAAGTSSLHFKGFDSCSGYDLAFLDNCLAQLFLDTEVLYVPVSPSTNDWGKSLERKACGSGFGSGSGFSLGRGLGFDSDFCPSSISGFSSNFGSTFDLSGAHEAKATLLLADSQTAGRGRMGRDWSSPASGDIYMTLVLFGRFPISAAGLIPLAVGLAAQRALQPSLNLDLGLKWPNDLVCAGRKMGGILCEAKLDSVAVSDAAAGVSDLEAASFVSGVHCEFDSDQTSFEPAVLSFIIGIGINVERLEFSAELRDIASSLRLLEPDIDWSRTEIVASVLREFAALWPLCLASDSSLVDMYAARCISIGQRVRALSPEGVEFEGVAIGLDSSGSLLVRDEVSASVFAVRSGEVLLL